MSKRASRKVIRDAQQTSEDLAELHRKGEAYYDREVLAAKRPDIPGGDVFGHYARTDLEVVGSGTRAVPDPMSFVRGTVQREYRIYRVPRGYVPEQYNYNVRSYEQLRAATEKDHTLQAQALKDAADFLEDAIEQERRR